MIKQLNRVLSIALIVAVVSVGVFWMLQRGKQVTTAEKATSPNQAAHHSPEWVQNYLENRELTEAENRKMQRVRESQAYQDFLATHPDSMKDFLDFYAAQGVALPQAAFLGLFREIFEEAFPKQSAAELEPAMREKLAMLFWERNIHAGTDPGVESVEDVVIAFFVEDANIAWAMQHFEGDYFAIGRWATDVLQQSKPDAVEGPTLSETSDGPVPAQGAASDAASDTASDTASQRGRKPVQGVTSPPFKELDVTIEPDADVLTESENGSQAELTLELSDATNESLETSLRDSFSPARFNRAMETLNRYGPEEGLRRLKASDPVVAEHVTRVLRRQQEENK